MIALLEGILKQKDKDGIVVDVHGVGYEVFVTSAVFETLPDIGKSVTFFVHTHVTEGSFTLYGFLTRHEKMLFRKLISVSGIGPKLGLQLLSGLKVSDLICAILENDLPRLTSISGIGKKTAERLVVELKDKLAGFAEGAFVAGPTRVSMPRGTYGDVLSALVNLGYPQMIAERTLSTLQFTPEVTVEEMLRRSLTALSGAGTR